MPHQYTPRVQKTCKQCGVPFSHPPCQGDRAFCSQACKTAFGWTVKNCVICGAEFAVIKCNVEKTRTCGTAECRKAIKCPPYGSFYGKRHTEETKALDRAAHLGPQHKVVCGCGCGTEFELPDFRVRMTKRGVNFLNMEHRKLFLRIQSEANWRRNMADGYGPQWPAISKAIRDRDKVCQHCGKTPEQNSASLDVHHIVPVRVRRDHSPENLIALCRSCHLTITRTEEIAANPRPPRTYEKVCDVCGATFITGNYQWKVCSPACKKKRQNAQGYASIQRDPARYAKWRAKIKRWQAENRDHLRQLQRESYHRLRARRLASEPPA